MDLNNLVQTSSTLLNRFTKKPWDTMSPDMAAYITQHADIPWCRKYLEQKKFYELTGTITDRRKMAILMDIFIQADLPVTQIKFAVSGMVKKETLITFQVRKPIMIMSMILYVISLFAACYTVGNFAQSGKDTFIFLSSLPLLFTSLYAMVNAFFETAIVETILTSGYESKYQHLDEPLPENIL